MDLDGQPSPPAYLVVLNLKLLHTFNFILVMGMMIHRGAEKMSIIIL